MLLHTYTTVIHYGSIFVSNFYFYSHNCIHIDNLNKPFNTYYIVIFLLLRQFFFQKRFRKFRSIVNTRTYVTKKRQILCFWETITVLDYAQSDVCIDFAIISVCFFFCFWYHAFRSSKNALVFNLRGWFLIGNWILLVFQG